MRRLGLPGLIASGYDETRRRARAANSESE